jgi:MraZ protein
MPDLALGYQAANMFLGDFRLTIDDKGRLTLPAKYRSDLARGVVITRGLDGCLRLYPVEHWQKIARQAEQLSSNQRDSRDYARYLFAGAHDLNPDKQDRILVPTSLRQYANLESEVVMIGLNNHFEIWNARKWDEKVRLQIEQHGEEIAERLGNLPI